MSGDFNRGNVMSGDVNRGNVMSGDVSRGNVIVGIDVAPVKCYKVNEPLV